MFLEIGEDLFVSSGDSTLLLNRGDPGNTSPPHSLSKEIESGRRVIAERDSGDVSAMQVHPAKAHLIIERSELVWRKIAKTCRVKVGFGRSNSFPEIGCALKKLHLFGPQPDLFRRPRGEFRRCGEWVIHGRDWIGGVTIQLIGVQCTVDPRIPNTDHNGRQFGIWSEMDLSRAPDLGLGGLVGIDVCSKDCEVHRRVGQ